MIRAGVIGLGYWGPKLARNLNTLADAKLAWVCDLDQSRLDRIVCLYPDVRATRDYRELLASDVDAVAIATPVRTHYRLAIDALRAGKHILVEKPLAACVEQAGEIVVEGRLQSRIVMVGHTFLYNPAVVAMKAIIASGTLGRIYYVNGMRVNLGLFQPDINVAWDLAPHDVSILLFVLGMSPLSASARGGVCVQQRKGLHDVAYLSFFFPNDVMADIQVSWLDPCKIRRYTVVGSEKMLVYDDIEPVNKIMIYDKGVEVLPPYSDTENEFHLSYRTGDAVAYPVEWVEPLKVQCQDFLDCIAQGKEPLSNGRMGLQVVRILESAQHSLLNGGSREVIGESRGFCAYRTRREVGPRCKDLCFREPVWL
ncbi:MAG: Gfo/Idh/MocA family oxidoreductase [Chloroflexi bacterium]|nr:Gfo/Idh/MocA family oxidoreductase [Chloroflexota bacterium]